MLVGAAQQLLSEYGSKGDAATAGMGYALAYPFGVLGVIAAMIAVRFAFRIRIDQETADYNASVNANQQTLESVQVTVTNPNLIGREIGDIRRFIDEELVISRIQRGSDQWIPRDETVLCDGDVLFGVSSPDNFDALRLKIGPAEVMTGSLSRHPSSRCASRSSPPSPTSPTHSRNSSPPQRANKSCLRTI